MHWQSHHITNSILFEHVLSDFLGFNLSQTVSRLCLCDWVGRSRCFGGLLDLDLRVTVFLIRFCTFLFLLFRFTLDISQGIPVAGVEAFMMEVTFLAVFSDFMKVIHVQLNVKRTTCLTKDE